MLSVECSPLVRLIITFKNCNEALQTEYLNCNVPHSKGIKIQSKPQGRSLRHIKHSRIYILPFASRKIHHLKRKCDEYWQIYTECLRSIWPMCIVGVHVFFFLFIEIVIWFSINLLVVYRESVNLIGYITRRLSADSQQLWIANVAKRMFDFCSLSRLFIFTAAITNIFSTTAAGHVRILTMMRNIISCLLYTSPSPRDA